MSKRTPLEEYNAAFGAMKSAVDAALTTFNVRMRALLEGEPRTGVEYHAPPVLVPARPTFAHKVQRSEGHADSKRVVPQTMTLTPTSKAILVTLAQWSPVRSTLSATFVAVFTGYSVKSGGFGKALANLRSAGLIEGSNAALAITEGGLRQQVGPLPPIPRGAKMRAQLVEMWTKKLDPCCGSILMYLEERAPEHASAQEVAEATRYSAKSGGFGKSLSKLRKLDLIDGPNARLTIHSAFGA